MREPNGHAAAANYLERNHERSLRHTTGRLLAGSSYAFRTAVTHRLHDDWPAATTVADQAEQAAATLIRTVHHAGTDWHIHRGVEAMGYLDWAWRKAKQITAGPSVG